MQDYLNALRDVVNRIGNERENNGVQVRHRLIRLFRTDLRLVLSQDQNNQVRTLTSSWRAHQQPHRQHLNHLPNPRNISFTIPDQQMVSEVMHSNNNLLILQDILHATSVIARSRVRQQLYHPEQQFAPCPRPPLWDEEMRAMMILWIARERRLFEWEMREMEHLLGLRGPR